MRRHWRTFLLLTLLASVALPAATTAAAPGDRLWSGLVSADAGKVVSPDWHEAIAVARSGDVYVAGSQATAASEDEDFLARAGQVRALTAAPPQAPREPGDARDSSPVSAPRQGATRGAGVG
jgi:hypothetical protein